MNSYLIEYGTYVKEHNIKNYVELDVDQIVGVNETRKLRDKLESFVGYPSILVWHSIRGKEAFIRDAKDYNYMALGFFLTEGLPASLTDKYAGAFVDIAHKNNCRIHGLGYTKFGMLEKIPFDSVDSSKLSSSYRYGYLHHFDIKKRRVVYTRPEGMRMKNSMALVRPSFIEWRKYQDWALNNLSPIWD